MRCTGVTAPIPLTVLMTGEVKGATCVERLISWLHAPADCRRGLSGSWPEVMCVEYIIDVNR